MNHERPSNTKEKQEVLKASGPEALDNIDVMVDSLKL